MVFWWLSNVEVDQNEFTIPSFYEEMSNKKSINFGEAGYKFTRIKYAFKIYKFRKT